MARRSIGTPEPKGTTAVRAWAVTLVVGLSLFAVFAAGHSTRAAVRNWDRYLVAFADLDCQPPPGQERLGFLAEVQYLAAMPNRLSVLDEDLAPRLADAFALHPRVEKVEEIVVLPKREVHVRLRFRIPAPSAAAANHRCLRSDDLP
jgi:hypothetical protein